MPSGISTTDIVVGTSKVVLGVLERVASAPAPADVAAENAVEILAITQLQSLLTLAAAGTTDSPVYLARIRPFAAESGVSCKFAPDYCEHCILVGAGVCVAQRCADFLDRRPRGMFPPRASREGMPREPEAHAALTAAMAVLGSEYGSPGHESV